MKKSFFRLLSVALISVFILISFSSCSKVSQTIDNINKAVEQNKDKDKLKTVKSADNLVEVTVPGSWAVSEELNEEAGLQVANMLEEKYLIVISESKDTFTEDFTINDYYDILSDNFVTGLGDAVIKEPVQTKVNGQKAIQFEATGSVEKVKIAYIVTIIETDGYFHQVLAWTLQNSFDKNKADLQQVLSTLKEIK